MALLAFSKSSLDRVPIDFPISKITTRHSLAGGGDTSVLLDDELIFFKVGNLAVFHQIFENLVEDFSSNFYSIHKGFP